MARWIIKDANPLISRDKELKKRPSVFVDDTGGVQDDINNISAA